VAAVARKTGRATLAVEAGERVRRIPGVRWVVLDDVHAAEASRIAASCRLRAADAVYASVAVRAGTTLVTLDEEVLARAGRSFRCVAPAAWSPESERPGV
jgi:predicted nucleic acid-binding protein